MEENHTRRVYIRRKRCLKECQKLINETLYAISLARGEKVQDRLISNQALEYANAVEASCWSPHLRISDDEFQSLALSKTRELCQTLLKKHIQETRASAHFSASISDIPTVSPVVLLTPSPQVENEIQQPQEIAMHTPKVIFPSLLSLSGLPDSFRLPPLQLPNNYAQGFLSNETTTASDEISPSQSYPILEDRKPFIIPTSYLRKANNSTICHNF